MTLSAFVPTADQPNIFGQRIAGETHSRPHPGLDTWTGPTAATPTRAMGKGVGKYVTAKNASRGVESRDVTSGKGARTGSGDVEVKKVSTVVTSTVPYAESERHSSLGRQGSHESARNVEIGRKILVGADVSGDVEQDRQWTRRGLPVPEADLTQRQSARTRQGARRRASRLACV